MSNSIFGEHPNSAHAFGEAFSSEDGETESRVPHRALSERAGGRAVAVAGIREMLVLHHTSPAARELTAKHHEAMARLGFGEEQARLSRFPTHPSTRKGNLAEVVLAEYVAVTASVALPVYRLRYNPNVDQSMKGDDVLAFDLDSDPVRIVVGEAKYRATSSADAVREIVEGLVRSHKGGIPASLQFVADRLFEMQQSDLGVRVFECAKLFALGRLRLDYVGLLLGDTRSAERVASSTPASLRRLAMISLGVENPDSLVDACFTGLER